MSDPTHTIVLRLDPSPMEAPDIDVRWEIEGILRANYPDITFFDDGYGFARHSDAMLLAYATSEPARLVDAIVKILEQETVLGNRLAQAAMVGLAARAADVEPGHEFANHRLVYPPGERGKPLPD
jgi:hypothetical protein